MEIGTFVVMASALRAVVVFVFAFFIVRSTLSQSCWDLGRADVWLESGLNAGYAERSGKNQSGELMWLVGTAYGFGADGVVLSPTQVTFPPDPTPFIWGDPVPYTDGVGTAPYPSVVCTHNGASVSWNDYVLTASSLPNVSGTIKAVPYWLPAPGSSCPSTMVTGNWSEDRYRTYKVAIEALGFDQDHLMHKFITATRPGIPIDDPDGSSYYWSQGTSINSPAAYAIGTKISLSYLLQLTPSITSTLEPFAFDLRIKVDNLVVYGPTEVEMTGSQMASGPIVLNLTTNKVMVKEYTFTWEISADGSTWQTIGQSGPHKIFWTHSLPLYPTFQASFNGLQHTPLFDYALQKACTYATGLSDSSQIFAAITHGISTNVIYDPGYILGAAKHPLGAYNEACLCSDHASLGRGLARSLGLDATVRYIFGGGSRLSGYTYKMAGGTGSYDVTAQFNRPANDGIVANPHFLYHAVVHPSGTVYYDPSYGDSYSSTWAALEMDPAADEWNNASFSAISFGPRGWVGCPHN